LKTGRARDSPWSSILLHTLLYHRHLCDKREANGCSTEAMSYVLVFHTLYAKIDGPFILHLNNSKMARIKFDLSSGWTKELSDTSKKIYSSKLNTLAKNGYDTPSKIWESPTKVVDEIKTITGDKKDDMTKMKRRQFLSAIFAVSPADKKSRTNPLHKYYQQCLPSIDAITGEKWKKRKDFV